MCPSLGDPLLSDYERERLFFLSFVPRKGHLFRTEFSVFSENDPSQRKRRENRLRGSFCLQRRHALGLPRQQVSNKLFVLITQEGPSLGEIFQMYEFDTSSVWLPTSRWGLGEI
ncbi:UNVERIFIED_CONTAM: hypothetical protein K2H54_010074 [Gekko kuhli]